MRTTLEHPDREFLARLSRLENGTILELCGELDVTATAVRQKLSRLMAAELVERRTVTAGRGRPYHVYRVSEEGRRQLGDGYGDLARLLWREMKQIEDTDIRARLMSRLRNALVQRYRAAAPAASLDERFQQLQRALDEQGIQADLGERRQGDEMLPVLREHHCPYHDLAAEDSTICDLERSVFGDVLGVPIALTQCCRDGYACCEFEPVPQ
ncbi:MAG: helix-turn-helix transcriptional regulator [Planctomycetaceae bacterium]